MVTTPREIADALIEVGVPENRAQRIAHAVDRAENAATKEDLDHAAELMQAAIRELRLESKLELEERFTSLEVRFAAIDERFANLEARMTGLEARMTGLEARMTVLEARMSDLEARLDRLERRLDRLEQRLDAEALRNEQRHRQLMLSVVGIGASLFLMLAGASVTVLLRLFNVI